MIIYFQNEWQPCISYMVIVYYYCRTSWPHSCFAMKFKSGILRLPTMFGQKVQCCTPHRGGLATSRRKTAEAKCATLSLAGPLRRRRGFLYSLL